MYPKEVHPHGGTLIQLLLTEDSRKKALEKAKTLKQIVVSSWTLSDIEMLAIGAYSPLTGFMNQEEYLSVLDKMRLPRGTVWTLPITLPIEKEIAQTIKEGEELALVGQDQVIYAILTVQDVFSYDQKKEAEKVFLTSNLEHPGVADLLKKPPYYLGGNIQVLELPKSPYPKFYRTPAETRRDFAQKGWKTIVGFQTRNPIHRAHEYIQKCALEIVDGLFLQPLVGQTKADDIPPKIRMESYLTLLKNFYPNDRVQLSVYPAAMRYAGPREAIFHALIRKNYGCTHFIVGRDHAGVGDFYGTYDSQKIFEHFSYEDLGIVPLFFEHCFYCTKCKSMASAKTCPHPTHDHLFLSGTQVRTMLSEGKLPPPEMTRPEVARILAGSFQQTEK